LVLQHEVDDQLFLLEDTMGVVAQLVNRKVVEDIGHLEEILVGSLEEGMGH
jgi:hypothetical protein